MRLAIVSIMSGAAWGGSEVLWSDTAAEALRAGAAVGVFVYRWPELPEAVRVLEAQGAHLFRRPRPLARRFRRARTTLHTIVRHDPWRDLIRFAPDVICVSQGVTHEFLLEPMLVDTLRRLQTPYVVINHLNGNQEPPGPHWPEIALPFLQGAARVAFVAQDNLRSAQRHLAHRLTAAVVLQNPVNLTSLEPVAWPVGSHFSMACVARLDIAYKGQDVLLEALAAAPWSEREWSLHLYSAGPSLPYLRALARYYDLTSHVVFHGHVHDVRAIWAEHHLLVLPSRTEGTPLALIEAMLCGRPAVVTAVGGNAEWIEEPLTGFIAEAATALSIGVALERAWLRRDRWEAMGLRGHEIALRRHDPQPGRTLLDLLRACTPAQVDPAVERIQLVDQRSVP